MPRSVEPVEFNDYVKGLFTEASPVNFPKGASLEEENFVLSQDGSRSRRDGIDLEDGYVEIDTGISPDSLVTSFFRWDNVGGDPGVSFITIQINNKLFFFDAYKTPFSANLVGTWTYSESLSDKRFSFASVDGKLVVATGRKDIDVFEYSGPNKFTILSKRLLVRDFFGVTDIAVENP